MHFRYTRTIASCHFVCERVHSECILKTCSHASRLSYDRKIVSPKLVFSHTHTEKDREIPWLAQNPYARNARAFEHTISAKGTSTSEFNDQILPLFFLGLRRQNSTRAIGRYMNHLNVKIKTTRSSMCDHACVPIYSATGFMVCFFLCAHPFGQTQSYVPACAFLDARMHSRILSSSDVSQAWVNDREVEMLDWQLNIYKYINSNYFNFSIPI